MKHFIYALFILALLACNGQKEAGHMNILGEQLEWVEEEFKNPPDESKVHTWYHWLNGHLSKEGITKDLEAMKYVGIEGFTLFNAAEGTPPGNALYYSDSWWDAFIHTKKEAKRLGLTMGIMNGPGWSTSGGPWNTPENSMMEVVWAEIQLDGGTQFADGLTTPQPVLGLERDMTRDPFVNQRYYMPRDYMDGYYADLAILAFPTPRGESEGNPFRIHNWWRKAGFQKMSAYARDTKVAPEYEVVDMDRIIDLTDLLDQHGNLQWDVPEGQWTILRVGYQPTGRSNHPAPEGGKGLEVNKMSADAVDIHWQESVMQMVEAGEEIGDRAISLVIIDSYEAGHQNWTKGFEDIFINRVGYDLKQYLPAIAGRVIGSIDETEQFLWDYRKLISDLINENYYGRFQELAHKNGLTFGAEGYGNFGNTDDFATMEFIDFPANEFWAFRSAQHGGTEKLASSTAHIYNRKLVGSEAFTGPPDGIFETHPRSIKAQGDWYMTKGINQFWLHTYTHCPYDQLPGLGLGTYGSRFNRKNTWWAHSKGWFEYLARCQYMLQQGMPHNDILFYPGEDAPAGPQARESLRPAIPFGYDYNYCNVDILEKLKVKDNKLVLPNGLEYSLLVVNDLESVRPHVLRTLKRLIEKGAIVVASPPSRLPGLANLEKTTDELALLTTQIWGGSDGEGVSKRELGKGMIYAGEAVLEALQDINLLPDFEFELIGDQDAFGPAFMAGQGVEVIHRRTDKTNVYFVSNQHEQPKSINAIFRVSDKQPELWDPETGAIVYASDYQKLPDGRMQVTLHFEEAGSVFVVFCSSLQKESSNERNVFVEAEAKSFDTPWEVSFDGNGAPDNMIFDQLIDISKHNNDLVRYFSGTIIYENTIHVDDVAAEALAILDLGQVEVTAEVFVNDQSAGLLWKRPYRMDISEHLKEGENLVRVEVANLWVNRIIGDQKLPDDSEWTTNTGSTARGMGLSRIPDWVKEGRDSPTGRKAFVSWKWEHLGEKEPVPSGLIGPVQISLGAYQVVE